VIGNRAQVRDRTAQTAAAGQVMHGVARAVGAGRFLNRRNQEQQPKYVRQGQQQAGPGSLQVPCGPVNG
jgi:hypothetical protein